MSLLSPDRSSRGGQILRPVVLLLLSTLLAGPIVFVPAGSAAWAQSSNPVVDASAQVPTAVAQTGVSAQAALQIDSAVQDVLASTGVPSASIAIVQNGRIVYLRAYGHAQLSPPVDAAPAMQYSIGSISKQFTAAAVLLLAKKASSSSTTPSRSICRISPARVRSPCGCFSRIPRATRTSGRRTTS